MTIQLVGGVLSARLVGADETETRANAHLPALRAREVNPGEVAAQAREHEADGFDRALVHIYSSWADPWLVAGHAAAATERLGVTVAHRPGVTEPTVAARQFATLDRLSGGRAAVHIVIGSSDLDVRRDGDRLPKNQRYRRAAEYLEVFDRALTSDAPFDFAGEFYSVEDGWTGFRPTRRPRPPISVGGSSPEAKQLAAQFADVYAGAVPTIEAAAALRRELDSLTAPLGRHVALWKQFRVVLGDTDRQARTVADETRTVAHRLLSALPGQVLAESAQFARDRERAGTGGLRDIPDLRDAGRTQLASVLGNVVVGSVSTVADHIAAYRAAGIEVVNIDASDATDHDRTLRRALLAELRRTD